MSNGNEENELKAERSQVYFIEKVVKIHTKKVDPPHGGFVIKVY
jgi:hypothetical protein